MRLTKKRAPPGKGTRSYLVELNSLRSNTSALAESGGDSFNDVEPFLHTLKMVQTVKPGVPTLVVVNALTPYTTSKKLMDWLYAENLDYKIATVARSEAFEQYIGSGQSVVGNDRYGRVSADIQRMNSDIFGLLGLSTHW